MADDTRDEALMIQRRRFEADPSRLDALDALVDMYAALRMRAESAALASVHAVLSGRVVTHWPEAPALFELAEPLEGVARVLFPQQAAPFPELGALVWEALSGTRNLLTRGLAQDRTFVGPANDFGRLFSAAVRLLQVPKGTGMALRTDLSDTMELSAQSTLPTVLVALPLARDTARARFLLGRTLEASRAAHLPLTSATPEEGAQLVAAVQAAFGRTPPGRLDANVGRLASRLYEAIPPRMLRRLQDVVEELGPRLTYAAWRAAVDTACLRAAMLVCGDFRAAAECLLDAAPEGVPRDAASAVRAWEPMRDLARFAASEEYLLLRWQRVRPDRW